MEGRMEGRMDRGKEEGTRHLLALHTSISMLRSRPANGNYNYLYPTGRSYPSWTITGGDRLPGLNQNDWVTR